MSVTLRVLLVEDNEDDALLALRALTRGGYEPLWRRVQTALALTEALEAERWQVILSDHRMPTFSSLEALRIVQERGLDVPFLIVSGTIGEEAAVSAMREGAHDYILKDNLARLPAAVERELREAEGRRARREAERRLAEAEARYRSLVEQVPAVTYRVSERPEGRSSYVSPQVEAIARQRLDAWLGEAWRRALHPADRERVLADVAESRRSGGRFASEYRIVGSDGAVVWLRDEGRWLGAPGSGERLLQGLVVDITERREAEETIHRLAYFDSLTGLPNRAGLNEHLKEALVEARARGAPLALLSLGLQRFAEVNATLGHGHGDRLLAAAAGRLAALGGECVVARIGGAKFAVICPGLGEPDALGLARRAVAAFQEPIVVEALPIEVGACVGTAMFPDHGRDADGLLRCADLALDGARRSIESVAVYVQELEPHDPRRLVLLGELRAAIESKGLRLEYQPKVDLRTARVVGAEALVRWRHPERGDIPPDEFIPMAEHSALIRPLTSWVLGEALRQCRAWRDAGRALQVAVNVSARSLEDPDLALEIESLLEASGVPPAALTVEITEGALMAEAPSTAATLERLHRRGILFSIDDFGTGYSSLAYLRRLPVAELKVDRSFVVGLSSHQGDLTVVRTVVDLGHHLGLRVVAEGVEDARTWDLLRQMGCDVAQGYHMARPMPGDELARWQPRADYGVAAEAKDPEAGDR